MEYCLNDQTISSKSYAEKSPPPPKNSLWIKYLYLFQNVNIAQIDDNAPFCCISSCNGKSSWNLELSELFCGECWLIRQIDTTFPVTMVFTQRRDYWFQSKPNNLQSISIFLFKHSIRVFSRFQSLDIKYSCIFQRYALDERCNWRCFMSVRRTASGGRSDMRPSVFGTMNSRRQKATAPAHSAIATEGF